METTPSIFGMRSSLREEPLGFLAVDFFALDFAMVNRVLRILRKYKTTLPLGNNGNANIIALFTYYNKM